MWAFLVNVGKKIFFFIFTNEKTRGWLIALIIGLLLLALLPIIIVGEVAHIFTG